MILTYEQKDASTGVTLVINITVPDPTPADIAQALAISNAQLKDNLLEQIIQKALVELINILVDKGTIALSDFPPALKNMINQYKAL